MAREKFVERDELALALRVDPRTITNWRKRHADFPVKVNGKRVTFPLGRCIAWYIELQRAEAAAAAAPEAPDSLEDAEERKAIADAEMAELKLARAREELVPVTEYRDELGRVLQRVRDRVLGMPGEFGSQVIGLASLPDGVRALQRVANAILAELESEADSAIEPEEAEEADATDAELVAT